MSDGLFVTAALVLLLLVLPAILGLVVDMWPGNGPRADALLTADHARARATLAYYNEVHDSHSG